MIVLTPPLEVRRRLSASRRKKLFLLTIGVEEGIDGDVSV